MKKAFITFLIAGVIVFIAEKSYSIQSPNVEEQKNINQTTVSKLKNFNNEDLLNWLDKFNKLGVKYIDDIKTCEKAHFNEEIDFFGLKISLRADILGWDNKKCAYEFTGNIAGLGKDIREVFTVPVSDTTLEKFKPLVKCNFSQKDLDLMAEILKEKHITNIEFYKKALTEEDFDIEKFVNKDKKLTDKESKFFQTLTNGKTCSISNKNELLLNFFDFKKEIDE